MSADAAFGTGLPYVLAVLVIGVTVAGSFLKPPVRRWIERYVFLPLAAVLLLGGLAATAWRGDWTWFAILLALGSTAVFRLVKSWRAAGTDTTKQTTGVTG